HETRSGGIHLLFRHASSLRCSADDRIAHGVHVRADAGYIIWWPREGLPVCEAPIAEWPSDVLAAAKSKFKGHTATQANERAALVPQPNPHAIVSREVPKSLYLAILHLVPELRDRRRVRGALVELVWLTDGRNTGLYRAGIRFRSLIAEGVMDEAGATELLTHASELNGYAAKAGAEAVARTIWSALSSQAREQHAEALDGGAVEENQTP